jgi:hypothetical protein
MTRVLKTLFLFIILKKIETLYIQNTDLKREKIMKPIFREFICPQCGELRHVNVNGICFHCNNENTLLILAKQRKLQHKLDFLNLSLKVESLN